MSQLYLSISNPALREAIAEQLSVSDGLSARLIDNFDVFLQQSQDQSSAVLVVDAEFYEAAPFGREPADVVSRPYALLLLGDSDDKKGVSESFALPLRLGHFVTRLRYYMDVAPLLRGSVLSFAGCRLEPQRRLLQILKSGETVRLTEKETALLAYLARSAAPRTRRDILAEVWGYDERIDTHTFETHLYQLRRKLEKLGDWLKVDGGTYRLAQEGDA